MNTVWARPIATLIIVAAFSHRGAAQTPPRDSQPVAPAVSGARSANVDSIYRPETVREYAFGTFGPRPIIRALALAGFDQWRKRPVSNPETWHGFEDRLGADFAQVAISRTIRFGLSRVVDQRAIRYHPCACGDTSSRLTYALLSPLRVNTPAGIRMSLLNPVSEIASGILVTSVRPGGFRVGEGVRNGIVGLAAESAGSLVREFWPWKWRPPFL